jgi:hypothetical protein
MKKRRNNLQNEKDGTSSVFFIAKEKQNQEMIYGIDPKGAS